MAVLSEVELRKLLVATLQKINGDAHYLPAINYSNDNPDVVIEIGRYGYEYVGQERGVELFRQLPLDTDELLYLVFSDITTSMAYQWEAKNRCEGQDTRILFYEKKMEWMSTIKKEFGERVKKEMEWDYRERPLSS